MDLRYPVGEFQYDGPNTPAQRQALIDQIAEAPAKLRQAIDGLSAEQLETPYRPDGWTVRQVVHHIADSHMNAVSRFKWALTEDNPKIKPYDEALWANLADGKNAPANVSIALIDALHTRWVLLLRSLKDVDFDRAYNHPENGLMSLDKGLADYAWHGRHHIAHITALKERMNWK
jgi:Mycothiol maleylpyruvate isomerase N-terminal domain.